MVAASKHGSDREGSMRLLIIQCAGSILTNTIKTEADKLIPKPEAISSMVLNLPKLNLPEFKYMLVHLQPDTVIIDPPRGSGYTQAESFKAMLIETIRQAKVNNGRIALISSVLAIGDSQLRAEGAVEFPFDPYGMLLHESEMLLEKELVHHYILRFPHIIGQYPTNIWSNLSFSINTDRVVNFCCVEDMAKIIMAKVQTGWYGKYHVTPNDELLLSQLGKKVNNLGKPLNDSLMSRYSWQMRSSHDLWHEIVRIDPEEIMDEI